MVKPITSETASLSVSEIHLKIVILEAGEMSLLLIQPQVVILGFLEQVRGAPLAHPAMPCPSCQWITLHQESCVHAIMVPSPAYHTGIMSPKVHP